MALNHSKVNETENKVENRKKLLTEKVVNYIEEYESFYLNVLKEMDIHYSNPYLD